MCLLLDVDDIDRMFLVASGYRDDEMQLRQRRALLMEGFAASLRLPDTSMLTARVRSCSWVHACVRSWIFDFSMLSAVCLDLIQVSHTTAGLQICSSAQG